MVEGTQAEIAKGIRGIRKKLQRQGIVCWEVFCDRGENLFTRVIYGEGVGLTVDVGCQR